MAAGSLTPNRWASPSGASAGPAASHRPGTYQEDGERADSALDVAAARRFHSCLLRVLPRTNGPIAGDLRHSHKPSSTPRS